MPQSLLFAKLAENATEFALCPPLGNRPHFCYCELLPSAEQVTFYNLSYSVSRRGQAGQDWLLP
eukprot:661815-Pelagomonas_calceolata.AAC.2